MNGGQDHIVLPQGRKKTEARKTFIKVTESEEISCRDGELRQYQIPSWKKKICT